MSYLNSLVFVHRPDVIQEFISLVIGHQTSLSCFSKHLHSTHENIPWPQLWKVVDRDKDSVPSCHLSLEPRVNPKNTHNILITHTIIHVFKTILHKEKMYYTFIYHNFYQQFAFSMWQINVQNKQISHVVSQLIWSHKSASKPLEKCSL